jgi:hypothetical protein
MIRCIHHHLSFHKMDLTGSTCGRRYMVWGVVFTVCAFAALAYANPPFETDDPGVFPRHTGEAYLFSAGGRSSGGVDLDASPGAEVNYSALPNTFFHLVIPMAYSDPNLGGSAYGLGDVELGFKWRFLSQEHHGIDVATFPLVELPTGNARRGLGSEKASYFLPLWMEKYWGPWTVYGGGGRWFVNDPGQRDWWFTGILIQRQITPSLYLGGEVFHETDDPDSTGFNMGGGYKLGGPWQVLFSAGRNITNVSDNRFSCYLGLFRTF